MIKFANLARWLFPYFCCLCGGESDQERDLCSVCARILPWIQDRCYRCGLRLESDLEAINCEKCNESPPNFDRLCVLFDYVPPATNLVTGLKFGRRLAFGRVLGELLAEKVLEEWYLRDTLPDAIIPVPLHIARLRKRGYNQALELLWPIYKQSKIPILWDLCQRIRATRPQSGLNAELRKQNLKSAFTITKSKRRNLQLEHVAIMDDVVTTGSTVSALCAVLKNAGVERIDIWCICRG